MVPGIQADVVRRFEGSEGFEAGGGGGNKTRIV